MEAWLVIVQCQVHPAICQIMMTPTTLITCHKMVTSQFLWLILDYDLFQFNFEVVSTKKSVFWGGVIGVFEREELLVLHIRAADKFAIY